MSSKQFSYIKSKSYQYTEKSFWFQIEMKLTMKTSNGDDLADSEEIFSCLNSDITMIDWNTFDSIENPPQVNNLSTLNFDEYFLNNLMNGLFNDEKDTSEQVVVEPISTNFIESNEFNFLDSDYDTHTTLSVFDGDIELLCHDHNFLYDFDETIYEPLEPISDSNSSSSHDDVLINGTNPGSNIIPVELNEIFPHMSDENNRRRRNLLYESTCRKQIDNKKCFESVEKRDDALVNHDYAQISEEKSFFCPVTNCNKIYAKSSHLKAHLRRHSGEKPFICDWQNCTWKFSRSDELARHKRSHYGIKPYKCDYCEKGFARSDHLAKHRRIHEKKNRSKLFSQKLK